MSSSSASLHLFRSRCRCGARWCVMLSVGGCWWRRRRSFGGVISTSLDLAWVRDRISFHYVQTAVFSDRDTYLEETTKWRTFRELLVFIFLGRIWLGMLLSFSVSGGSTPLPRILLESTSWAKLPKLSCILADVFESHIHIPNISKICFQHGVFFFKVRTSFQKDIEL